MANIELDSDYLDRFAGVGRLYGVEGLAKFQAATVTVIGIGGVGSWVAEALARSGIGHIRLIDMDDVCVTNINRQLHALSTTVGLSKAQVMAERMREINPELVVEEIEAFITVENLDALLGEGAGFIVDAIDATREKTALINYAKRRKIPLITIGGAGGQIDPRQVTTADLAKTKQDPLLAAVRAKLRREYGFPKEGKKFGVEAVFSTEQQRYPQPDGSVCGDKPFEQGATRIDCSGGLGAATFVTGTFAFVAVARVMDRLATAR